jgi:signal peptidase I
VAVAGDIVVIDNGMVMISRDHERNVGLADGGASENTSSRVALTIGKRQYFAVGDNRAASTDSRSFGAVDYSQVVGRPILRLLPISRMAVRP